VGTRLGDDGELPCRIGLGVNVSEEDIPGYIQQIKDLKTELEACQARFRVMEGVATAAAVCGAIITALGGFIAAPAATGGFALGKKFQGRRGKAAKATATAKKILSALESGDSKKQAKAITQLYDLQAEVATLIR
jgi:hypothetical protein